MSKSHENKPVVDQQLLQAWKSNLAIVMNETDEAQIIADAADPHTLRITIATAGHSGYTFDFKCTYVDDREVQVELIDAEKANRTIDERAETVQQLVEDYVRHIHECAQALQAVTHA